MKNLSRTLITGLAAVSGLQAARFARHNQLIRKQQEDSMLRATLCLHQKSPDGKWTGRMLAAEIANMHTTREPVPWPDEVIEKFIRRRQRYGHLKQWTDGEAESAGIMDCHWQLSEAVQAKFTARLAKMQVRTPSST